jgi:hypothetical protein
MVVVGASVAGVSVVGVSVVGRDVSATELEESSPPHAESEIAATRLVIIKVRRIDMLMSLSRAVHRLEVGTERFGHGEN